jgi:hypothetical protein
MLNNLLFAHYAARGLLSPPVTGFGHLLVENAESYFFLLSFIIYENYFVLGIIPAVCALGRADERLAAHPT